MSDTSRQASAADVVALEVGATGVIDDVALELVRQLTQHTDSAPSCQCLRRRYRCNWMSRDLFKKLADFCSDWLTPRVCKLLVPGMLATCPLQTGLQDLPQLKEL